MSERPDFRRLNLGCGMDIRSGWVNTDVAPLPGVDRVFDLDEASWPFADGSFDLVLARDVLEHCSDLVHAMGEICRLLSPGGELHIQGPHFTSRSAHLDPTHVRSFSCETFHFFSHDHPRSYYSTMSFSSVLSVKISFDVSRKLPWNALLQAVVNSGSRAQRFYEMSPLRLFPAQNVEIVLIK